MNAQPAVRVKRVYEDPDPADGVRILVDRLWPRGVRKQDLAHDAWLKDAAPSGDYEPGTGTVRSGSRGLRAATARSCDRAYRPTRSSNSGRRRARRPSRCSPPRVMWSAPARPYLRRR